MRDKTKKEYKILKYVERMGNKIPHTATMFIFNIAVVLILSVIFSAMGTSAVSPVNGETITVVNMLKPMELVRWLSRFHQNFTGFAVLGPVVCLGIATGICERSGMFESAIKLSLTNITGNAVVFLVSVIGVNGNIAGDAAFILIPSLAGLIFYGMGRHPLAGVFLGYASTGGAFSLSFVPGLGDHTYAPVTIQSAQSILPGFDMSMLSGYYVMVIGTLLIGVVSTIVTVYFVEPMLGKYHGHNIDDSFKIVKPEEKRALKYAAIVMLAIVFALIIVCIPSNSIFRNPETGSLINGAPLMRCVVSLLFVIFFSGGMVYSVAVGKVKNMTQAMGMINDTIKTLAPFIAMAVIIAQFLYFFNTSNLATILAINGGNWITSLQMPKIIIALIFFLFVALVNMFIGSASTKWLLLAPVFVPIMTQIGFHPAFTQIIYRLGDGVTNHITPLFVYFSILLTTAQKYDEDAGFGTLVAGLLPFCIGYAILYALMIIAMVIFNLPLGPGGSVWL